MVAQNRLVSDNFAILHVYFGEGKPLNRDERMITGRNEFLLSWLMATTIGIIAGWKLFDNSGPLKIAGLPSGYIMFLTWVIEIGVLIGFLQWLVIQQELKAKWWLVATSLGLLVSGILGGGIQEVIGDGIYNHPSTIFLGSLLIGGSVGFCVGISQWLYLRHVFPRSSTWIIASTLGWAFGLALFRTLNLPHLIVSVPLGPLIFNAFSLSIPLAGITGFTLHEIMKG